MSNHTCPQHDYDDCNHQKRKCPNKKQRKLFDQDEEDVMMKNLLFILVIMLIIGISIVNVTLIVWLIRMIMEWVKKSKTKTIIETTISTPSLVDNQLQDLSQSVLSRPSSTQQ
jgi:flagellar basal body-associated protein FliL